MTTSERLFDPGSAFVDPVVLGMTLALAAGLIVAPLVIMALRSGHSTN